MYVKIYINIFYKFILVKKQLSNNIKNKLMIKIKNINNYNNFMKNYNNNKIKKMINQYYQNKIINLKISKQIIIL